MDYLNVHDRLIDDKETDRSSRESRGSTVTADGSSIFTALNRVLRDALDEHLGALEERLLRRVEQVVQHRLEAIDTNNKRELASMHTRLARLEERAIDMQSTLADLDGDLKRRRRANFS